MTELQERIAAVVAESPELSSAEIARRVGCDRSVVWKARNPERARELARRSQAAARAWAAEHDRQPCSRCGRLMGVGARRKGTVHCGNCHRELEEARVRERAEWIAEMWAAGLRTGEIAAALGWTLGHVSREIVRIRKRSPGLLPYRRKTHAGRVLR